LLKKPPIYASGGPFQFSFNEMFKALVSVPLTPCWTC